MNEWNSKLHKRADLNDVIIIRHGQLDGDWIVAVIGRGLEGVLLGDVRARVLRRVHRGPEVGPAVQASRTTAVNLEKNFIFQRQLLFCFWCGSQLPDAFIHTNTCLQLFENGDVLLIGTACSIDIWQKIFLFVNKTIKGFNFCLKIFSFCFWYLFEINLMQKIW